MITEHESERNQSAIDQAALDRTYMRRALTLAAFGVGKVDPNPMVGAVIVKDGRVIGQGYHQQIGGLHAERNAFKNLTEDAKGATLYVTLEPCCHYGRTPPCTEAILEHGISRVVAACLDPNPLVAGNGMRILQEAGVQVESGVLQNECRALNRVFFHYITTGTPFVVMKYAMTLDGRIATGTGDSKWVTGEKARAHVQQTRNRLPAILVGRGTVEADDPALTCRIPDGRNPIRVICDSHLSLSTDHQVFQTAREIPTIVATLGNPEREQAFTDLGVELLVCKEKQGRVDLTDLMRKLGAKQISGLLIEGGSAIHGAALTDGIVNQVQAYISPKLVGGQQALSPVGGNGIPTMADALKLKDVTVSRLGEDILVEGFV